MKPARLIAFTVVVLGLLVAALSGPKAEVRARTAPPTAPIPPGPSAPLDRDLRALEADVRLLARRIAELEEAQSQQAPARSSATIGPIDGRTLVTPASPLERNSETIELEERILAEPMDAEWSQAASHELAGILDATPLGSTPAVMCASSLCRVTLNAPGVGDMVTLERYIADSALFDSRVIYDEQAAGDDSTMTVYLHRSDATE